jgi:2-phosphosulfolactate phosphatase
MPRMKVDVLFLPDHATSESFANRSVVVFDVLRATTTMTAALAAGVKEIHVFPDTASVRKSASEVGLFRGALMCGEERCLRPEGFDLGNSPGAFTREYTDRTVFMSTTNGTRAILAAQGAALLLAGALVNASAVAAVLADAGMDVTLLCAGTNGRVAMEDVIGAGAVLTALGRKAHAVPASDAARIAVHLYETAKNDLPRVLAEGDGGRNVIAAGLREDIAFCASVDRFKHVVGVVEGRKVRARRVG